MEKLYFLDWKPVPGKPGLLVCTQSGNVCDSIFTVVEFPGTFTKISICQLLIMDFHPFEIQKVSKKYWEVKQV